MEIHGSSFPPAPYAGTGQAGKPPQQAAREDQNRQAHPLTIPPAVNTTQSDYEHHRKRSYSLETDLSHPARQAINSYRDTDFASGPELMNRVDVYA